MTTADFKSQFDSDGHFKLGDGALSVVFATRGGTRFPGTLYFSKSLCVRAEMTNGGEWVNPDNAPLHGIRFLLEIDKDTLQSVVINEGRVISIDESTRKSTRRSFLDNLRVARNLFAHPQVHTDSAEIDAEKTAIALARAAIWLTPRSVAGFDIADFPELTEGQQIELQAAVKDFLSVANQVPADKPATIEQYRSACSTLQSILSLLNSYLPRHDESREIEMALQKVEFPPWVVNWDFELASDSEGMETVWVNVFGDEEAMPWTQLGRVSLELRGKVRDALYDARIARYPYIRMRTAQEHKSLTGS